MKKTKQGSESCRREHGKGKTGNDELRVGVVGLRQGVSHVAVMKNKPGFRVVGVCDLDEKRRHDALAAGELEDACAYTNYEQMLDESGLDAVVIATPPHVHEAMALAALKRGKHVLLEKPMAHSLDAGRRIREAAGKNGAVLQVGFEMRSSPLVQEIGRIMASGDLGDVVFLWVTMFRGLGEYNEWRRDRRNGGGQFFDCLVHEFDELLHWTSADFERVCVFGAPRDECGPNPDENADTAAVCIEFANGIRASVGFSQISQTTNDTHFGVVGTRGRIDGDPWLPEGAGSLQVYTEGGLYRKTIAVSGSMASQGHLGFVEQYDRWLATIRRGAPNICDAASVLRTMTLMKALDISMSEYRPVTRAEIKEEQA